MFYCVFYYYHYFIFCLGGFSHLTTLEGRIGHDALFYTPLTIASLRDETRMNLRCMAKYLENTDFSKNIFTEWRMSCAIQVVVLFVRYASTYTRALTTTSPRMYE